MKNIITVIMLGSLIGIILIAVLLMFDRCGVVILIYLFTAFIIIYLLCKFGFLTRPYNKITRRSMDGIDLPYPEEGEEGIPKVPWDMYDV